MKTQGAWKNWATVNKVGTSPSLPPSLLTAVLPGRCSCVPTLPAPFHSPEQSQWKILPPLHAIFVPSKGDKELLRGYLSVSHILNFSTGKTVKVTLLHGSLPGLYPFFRDHYALKHLFLPTGKKVTRTRLELAFREILILQLLPLQMGRWDHFRGIVWNTTFYSSYPHFN